jgi:amino-acid N-acetyltransferase
MSGPPSVYSSRPGCRLGGFPDDLEALFVATSERRLLGVAGLEVHGIYGLLRSLAIAPEAREQGLARDLCTNVEDRAAELGLQLFLLTETAERFFKHRGWEVIDRRHAPDEIRSSREFSDLCPDFDDGDEQLRRGIALA